MAGKKRRVRRARIAGRSKRSKTRANRYDAKFYKIVPSTIFGILGLFYILAPYEKILELGLNLGKTNAEHTAFGLVFLAIAAAAWFFNSRKK